MTDTIIATFESNQWQNSFSPDLRKKAIERLENGKLLFFPQLNFELTAEEQRFLSPAFVHKKSKNISYDASEDRVKGFCGTEREYQQIKTMMARFYASANTLIRDLFPSYQDLLQPARTSFRPAQVSNRKMSYRKDDRLLHVDAFPANPNQGKRILRVFSNINPHGEDRVWHIGEPFMEVAKRFLPNIPKPFWGSHVVLEKLSITKSKRTAYDHIMLHMHDGMKKDCQYQQQVNKTQLRLPPCSSWIVQTDHVSHAALGGQHLLEQTFCLPVEAMDKPELSPLRILESLLGKKLT